MRRLVRCVATALLAVVWVALPTPRAEAVGNQITRMVVDAQIDLQGRMTVVQTLDMKLTGANDHGPYLFFKARHETNDPLWWRVLKYQLVSVTSPTGAPAQVQTSEGSDGTFRVRIGDPKQTVSGLQTYVVTYTIDGVVNPRVAASGMDEVFWNAIGTGFQVPVSNITVTVTSPVAVAQTQCWAGSGSACDGHTHSGGVARFVQGRLSPGQGLSVVAGWPAGTFASTPILERRVIVLSEKQNTVEPSQSSSVNDAFGRRPWGPWAAAGLCAVIIGVRVGLARRNRDQMYTVVTPGLTPAPGTTPTVKPVDDIPVAVRFTPPDGLTPGMVGTLVDETADISDVTATIVDLAVRGYLRLEAQPEISAVAFRLVRLQEPDDGLLAFERSLMEGLFSGGEEITTLTLARSHPENMVMKCRAQLDKAVTEAGLFRSSPEMTRASVRSAGVLTLVGGLIFSPALATFGVAELAVAPIVAGLAIIGYARQAPVRTADGTAAYIQALGFRLYLKTAEADQLRWEESEDIFSRYLPYAIAFGCADRWVAIFTALADQGLRLPEPTWYAGGRDNGAWDYQASLRISRSVETVVEHPQWVWDPSESGSSFSSGSSSSWSSGSSSTWGSSGGSGFSSGGYTGGSGGGLGGGGGGSW